MLGAIIGDTVGSRFEWHNHRSKDFDFLTYKCEPTDDSIMTLAIAKAILKSEGDVNKLPDLAVRYMQKLGRLYPDTGYGGLFENGSGQTTQSHTAVLGTELLCVFLRQDLQREA